MDSKRHSRIARIPLATVHFRFGTQVAFEKRLRNRSAEGNEKEMRKLLGAGANVNATNEVCITLPRSRQLPTASRPHAPVARHTAELTPHMLTSCVLPRLWPYRARRRMGARRFIVRRWLGA